MIGLSFYGHCYVNSESYFNEATMSVYPLEQNIVHNITQEYMGFRIF